MFAVGTKGKPFKRYVYSRMPILAVYCVPALPRSVPLGGQPEEEVGHRLQGIQGSRATLRGPPFLMLLSLSMSLPSYLIRFVNLVAIAQLIICSHIVYLQQFFTIPVFF